MQEATNTNRIVFANLVLLSLWRTTAGAQLPAPELADRPALQAAAEIPALFRGNLGGYRSPLLTADGQLVTTSAGWRARRQEMFDFWMEALGPWPPRLTSPPLEVLSESDRENFRQQHVRVSLAPDVTGLGWLLRPRETVDRSSRPAVLVVYYDADTSVGMNSAHPQRDFALQLARRGFVTLAIGTPGGDARQPDLGAATCQPLAFHAYVASNCLTALANLPEVDGRKIGVVGHSYGGKWAMFAAALDERFAAVAVSDPGIVFDETRIDVNYWDPWYLGRDSIPSNSTTTFIPDADHPRRGVYRRLLAGGHDLVELHALLAPRPFLVSGGSEDPPSRWMPLQHLVEVNRMLGFENRVFLTNRSHHAPTPASNAVIIDFFEFALSDRLSTATR